ncbi:MAG: S9 family peptidase [Lysobacteraceae bacterium]|nr:MAG: S9 family peptidase [Xanthomonadaceae bacterium]
MQIFAQTPKPHEVEDFIRKAKFNEIKISPTGEFYAATVPIEHKTALVILRRADNKLVSSLSIPGARSHVGEFWWVNDERVLISAVEKFEGIERPSLTGELYAVNADGGKGEMLVGARVQGEGPGTRVQPKKVEMVAASLVDDLPNDDKYVIISVFQLGVSDPYARVERLNVYTGHRVPIAQAPIRNASYVTDNAGNVRFAIGSDIDLSRRLYYREAAGGEWKLLNDSAKTGLAQYPLGFSGDDKIAYLLVEHETGPNSVVAWTVSSDERKQIFRDDDTDPQPVYYNGKLAGYEMMDGLPRKEFIDPQSVPAKLYRKLEKAFKGQNVFITSTTTDGRIALVLSESDRNIGDFFVFDTTTNKADYLLSRKDWIDPQRAADSKPVSFKARDGLDVRGYLTSPVGGEAKNAPLVILIHGGPFGIYDSWGFDKDAQLLAAHGYAVLQVNYRGSGNHGHAFEAAGKRQWGRAMQDDITDATQWAIRQGIADPKRICLYGASYGGYASLMGVAKEPDLYRCAIGYVGAYDLPTMHTMGDIQERGSGEAFIEEWIGLKENLVEVSPNRIANRIKVPVFLAAGGEDDRTPMKHTELMEKALREANVPVEAIYYPTEGHGFYKLENEREFYGKILTFLSKHIGGRMPVIENQPAKK